VTARWFAGSRHQTVTEQRSRARRYEKCCTTTCSLCRGCVISFLHCLGHRVRRSGRFALVLTGLPTAHLSRPPRSADQTKEPRQEELSNAHPYPHNQAPRQRQTAKRYQAVWLENGREFRATFDTRELAQGKLDGVKTLLVQGQSPASLREPGRETFGEVAAAWLVSRHDLKPRIPAEYANLLCLKGESSTRSPLGKNRGRPWNGEAHRHQYEQEPPRSLPYRPGAAGAPGLVCLHEGANASEQQYRRHTRGEDERSPVRGRIDGEGDTGHRDHYRVICDGLAQGPWVVPTFLDVSGIAHVAAIPARTPTKLLSTRSLHARCGGCGT
jgi:hypothetical protein